MPIVLPAHLSPEAAFGLCESNDLDALTQAAAVRRDAAHGALVSYSRKVFIPLTRLCRDVCHYCTFAQPPRRGHNSYLSLDEVLALASAGVTAGCKEALFTLGDKPELRYSAARNELARLGHATTISYLEEAARAVLEQTGLLPHVNPGVSMRAKSRRCAKCRFRKASCWRAGRNGCASAAVRISDRPTRVRRCGS